jgi:chromate transporter
MLKIKLISLFTHCALFSILAVGGVSSTLADLHHYLVEHNHWLSNEQFFSLYAIAQAAPGPNIQFVTIFGWQIAGLMGAVVSILGMCGPSSVAAIFFDIIVNQYQHMNWSRIVKKGLVPVSVGLFIANGWMISRHVDASSWKLLVLTFITILLNSYTKIHPFWLIIIGAVSGVIGIL